MMESAKARLDTIAGEEDDYRDNMPESLQESQRYYDSEEASEAMDTAKEALDEAINALSNI